MGAPRRRHRRALSRTALVLGDQLSRGNPALEGAGRVLLVEAFDVMGRPRRHRRRLHLVLVAMRRFAAELREAGVEVDHRVGARSIREELRGIDGEVVCAAPHRHGARRSLAAAGVRFVPTTQFLTGEEQFAGWAAGRRRLVMEDFYREQRRRFGLLLDEDGRPEGGRWNFDTDNRRPPVEGLVAPPPWLPVEDATDAWVREDLDRWTAEGRLDPWGQDGPRGMAADPVEARAALASFVRDRLPGFGPWQDAMVPGERTLFHSLLSAPMNLGLLDPLEVVRAAEAAYRAGDVPLQSAEGFIRQVVGWREYVWGTYWLRREQWPQDNALDADVPLPGAYWGQPTTWNCLDTVVGQVQQDGYAHHIERLMVLGNIGLTAGVRPWDLVQWFEGVFVDGAEWVMAPNAAGMSLFADGGEMVTKPYAAGGNYINKMSGFCPSCRYSPTVHEGPEACPVTALYWAFVERHRERLADNRRTQRAVSTLDRFPPERRAALRERAGRAMAQLSGASSPPP